MAQATGSRLQLGYIAEVTPGTTPATPNLKGLAATDVDIQLTKGLMSDGSFRADRQKRFSRHGNKAVGGSLKVNYTTDEYDDLLAGVFSADWATDVLRFGNTEKSFTVEHAQADIGVYRLVTGTHFTGMTLTIPSGNQVVTAAFDVMGMNMAFGGSTVDTSGAYDAPTSTVYGDPLVHLDASFQLGGSSIAYLTGMTIVIGQNPQANYALGSATARSITNGMISVTGQVTAYFESAALATLFVNETNSSLKATLVNGAKSQEWYMPVVQFNGANIPVNSDGPIIVTLPYEALYDASTGSVLRVTRVV